MSDYFFTSDEHYNHKNVIKFCQRPFSSVEEMEEILIQKHNEIVKPGSLVFHLGDMFWFDLALDRALSIKFRLNGQHFYVKGNHEELFKNKQLVEQFVWVKDLAEVTPAGYPRLVLCHYCMRTFNGSHRGSYHLFGHSHGKLPESVAGATNEESPLSMDVGVDTNNYYPWALEDIDLIMKKKNDHWQKLLANCADCGVSMKSVLTEGIGI